MKPRRRDRSLESFKIFPFLAWAVVIVFAYYVYQIALELQEVTDNLYTPSAAAATEHAHLHLNYGNITPSDN